MLKCKNRKDWEIAMKEEIKILNKRNVWTLVDLPPNVTPLGCRWVYTLKKDEKGDIVRYKARLVAQGYLQVKGVSYDETFSPVVNFAAVRFFFSLLVSFNGWIHVQCDIKGAYLYANLKEDIYMKQPPGFIVKGKEEKVCKLNKTLYGLHQSGREWFFEIDKTLTQLGFIRYDSLNCVYRFQNHIVLLLYVDDIVIFGKNDKVIKSTLNKLENHFDIKIMGKTKLLLGVEFEEKDDYVFLNQTSYINEVCNRFSKFKYPISSLPISKGSIYSKSQCPSTDVEINEMKQFPYRNLLGCLSYIASRTRPDINYAVNIYSQFQSNPGVIHWEGLLKLLGYLHYTKNLKLKLYCKSPQIIAYSDADYASNRDDRTSLGGQIILLDKSPVNWRTFKQKSVSLSTMESEFYALAETSKEIIWFNRILDECINKNIIKCNKTQSVMYVDNLATIDFVKSPIENVRSKHIDVKLFFIRDLIRKELFFVKFVKSKENLADCFTKPQTKYALSEFKSIIFK